MGPAVWTAITAAARACVGPSHVAVAYFGREGPRLLPLKAGSVLVVDASVETVTSGGTSPAALRRMLARGIRVFSAQNLHAKVFVFDAQALVGSANASTRSARYLMEAVASLDDPSLIDAARAFVLGIAITELTDADLIALEALYRPPAPTNFPPRQAPFTTLIMELTREQGGRRATQVQPPLPAWEKYFGVGLNTAPLPRLHLNHIGPQAVGAAPGTISKHDHNLTIEIPGAELPRPALLELRKSGRNRYDYQVHRPGPEFTRLRRLLDTRANPLYTRGRKWLII